MFNPTLIKAVAALKRSAPAEFNALLAAYSTYHHDNTENLIMSPLPELHRAQGRAQNSAQFLDLLSNCLEMADKTERKPHG